MEQEQQEQSKKPLGQYEDIDMETIDVEELEKNKRDHIVKVAKTIGVSPSGKKSQILERIKNTIKKYKENKEKSKYYKFTVSVYDLPIKDIDKNETLFWKVFRNLCLFKNIVSFLSVQIGIESFKYNDIICVKWILDNNHIELLKDKIKHGKQLSFAYIDGSPPIKYVYKQFFKKLDELYKQNNDEIKQIVKLLFRNYPHQFDLSSIKEEEEGEYDCNYDRRFNTLLQMIIRNKSIVALIALVEDFNVKLNINHLAYSITKVSSTKLTRFIYENIQKRQDNPNEPIPQQKELKNLIMCTDDPWNVKRVKLTNYLISIGISQIPIKPSNIHPLYDISAVFINGPIENDFKLSDLIETCYYICKYYVYNEEKIKEVKDEDRNKINIWKYDEPMVEPKVIISIQEIDEFKSTLSKQELKSKLLDILSTKQGRENQFIKKLYEFYLEYAYNMHKDVYLRYKTKKHYYYNIIYNCGFDNITEQIKDQPIEDDRLYKEIVVNYIYYSYQFANIGLFKCLMDGRTQNLQNIKTDIEFALFRLFIENINSVQLVNYKYKPKKIEDSTIYPPVLFSKCLDDKERQLQFLEEMFKLIDENMLIFDPYLLFYLVIEFDDIELFTHFNNLSKKHKLITNNTEICQVNEGNFNYVLKVSDQHRFTPNIYRFIKSIEMLDFVFKNFKSQLLKSPVSELMFLGRNDLLSHVELLLSTNEFDNYSSSNYPLLNTIDSILDDDHDEVGHQLLFGLTSCPRLLKSICYMLTKPDLYSKFGLANCSKIVKVISKLGEIEKEFEDLKFLIENMPIDVKYNPFGLSQLAVDIGSLDPENQYCIPDDRNPCQVEFLDWVLTNRKPDIDSGRCTFNSRQYLNALYLTGRLDELFNNTSFIEHLPLIGVYGEQRGYIFIGSHYLEINFIAKLIGLRGDIDFISRLFNYYSNNPSSKASQSKKSTLMFIFKWAVKYGKLNVFQYVFHNHREVLLKNTPSKPVGWYTTKDFKKLLSLSIRFDQFPLFSFFIKELGHKVTSNLFESSLPPLQSAIAKNISF